MIAVILVGIFSFLYLANTPVAMTSNVNTQTSGQSVHSPKPASSASGTAHAPSVPISLYREVAGELQTTRTTLQSIKAQNQELLQKNQQLRLEIERVVQSALHLRQVADSSWGMPNFPESLPSPAPTQLTASSNSDAATPSNFAMPPGNPSSKGGETRVIAPPTQPNKLRTEQTIQPLQPEAEVPTEISTWWLVLLVCFIVVTAFGTGFLIVRPLLPSR